MDRALLKIVILVIILALIKLYEWSRRRRAAQRISKSLDQSFQPDHVFRAVQPSSFPWLTQAFYDGSAADAASAGFRPLADIEDETLTASHPDKRTFVRILSREGGDIRTAIYEIAVGGPQGNVSKRIQTRELITEMSDGATLTTTTAPLNRLLNPPPGQVRQHVAEGTPFATLLTEHMRSIEHYQVSNPQAVPVPVRTFEEATAAWQKGIDRQRNRLQAGGGITREEMVRIGGPARAELAGKVHDEMQRMR
jgi:hypothetical protein